MMNDKQLDAEIDHMADKAKDMAGNAWHRLAVRGDGGHSHAVAVADRERAAPTRFALQPQRAPG
jgi:hypothetical protein